MRTTINRHSLVIGGTRGLGLHFARSLHNDGNRVSLLGRQAPDKPISNKSSLTTWKADLTKAAHLKSTLDRIIKESGPVQDVVFFQRYRGGDDNWDEDLKTTLTATQLVLNHLFEQKAFARKASMVVVGSVASSLVVSEQPASYHVVKAALLQLVRYQAVRMGPQDIRVNMVSPGTIVKDEAKKFYDQPTPVNTAFLKTVPLKRMGTADDLTSVVRFLCSEAAGFITGQNIVLDGGMSLLGQESLLRSLVS